MGKGLIRAILVGKIPPLRLLSDARFKSTLYGITKKIIGTGPMARLKEDGRFPPTLP